MMAATPPLPTPMVYVTLLQSVSAWVGPRREVVRVGLEYAALLAEAVGGLLL